MSEIDDDDVDDDADDEVSVDDEGSGWEGVSLKGAAWGRLNQSTFPDQLNITPKPPPADHIWSSPQNHQNQPTQNHHHRNSDHIWSSSSTKVFSSKK